MTLPDPSQSLLLLHAAATWYMVGLVWFVQRVHYPLFARVGAEGFTRYEREHVARTSPVVGPPMLLEAGSALLLVWLAPPSIPPAALWVSLGLLAVVWASTASLQVPRHRDLSAGFDARQHARLVGSNWLRTAAWSLRGALALWMLHPGLAVVPA